MFFWLGTSKQAMLLESAQNPILLETEYTGRFPSFLSSSGFLFLFFSIITRAEMNGLATRKEIVLKNERAS